MVNIEHWIVLFIGITLCVVANGRPDLFIPEYSLPQGPLLLQHPVPKQINLVPQYINIPVHYPPVTGQIYQIPIGYSWQTTFSNQHQPPVSNDGQEYVNVQTVQVVEEDDSNPDYSAPTQVPETTEYFDGNNWEDNQQQLQQRQSALFVEPHPTNSGRRPATSTDQFYQESNVNEVRAPNIRSRLGYEVNEGTGNQQESVISQQYREPLLAATNQLTKFDDSKQTQQQQQEEQARPTRPSNVMSMLPHKRQEFDFSAVIKQVDQEVKRIMEEEQQSVQGTATNEEAHFMGLTSNNQAEKLTYAVDGS